MEEEWHGELLDTEGLIGSAIAMGSVLSCLYSALESEEEDESIPSQMALLLYFVSELHGSKYKTRILFTG